MAHKPFHLYKRPTLKKNKFLYYVRFYDDQGNRMAGRSTGQTSKAAAETWAIEQLKLGICRAQKNISFEQYARNWWIWENCPYIQGRLARGATISRNYADSMRSYLDNYLLPFFGSIKLQKITAVMIEKWLMRLREEPGKKCNVLSPTTINLCLTCLKIMLKEATRMEYVVKNPAVGIVQLRETPRAKSILGIVDVGKLFGKGALSDIWKNDLRCYTANLLSASTGMRLGEVQALQIGKVHNDYIEVGKSWSRKYGMGPPKWNSVREIPIPTLTSIRLHELIEMAFFNEPDDFVFFSDQHGIPLGDKSITGALYRALERIGISPQERKKQNITFHSWRHFYNTLMRGKIHDAKLRQLTGHRTLEMTETYTHFQIEDFKDVLNIQNEYFS